MRVVIDTNVLISGLFFPESHPGRVICGWLSGCFEAVLSAAVVAEYTEVILRPKFRRFGPEPGRFRKLLELLTLKNTVMVQESETSVPLVRDPKDTAIVRCAVLGQVDVLVTGDEDLLAVGKLDGVEVLSPREFLERMSDGASLGGGTA